MRKFKLFFISLLVSILLLSSCWFVVSACNNCKTPTPTYKPKDTPHPPTDTPEPEPTQTPGKTWIPLPSPTQLLRTAAVFSTPTPFVETKVPSPTKVVGTPVNYVITPTEKVVKEKKEKKSKDPEILPETGFMEDFGMWIIAGFLLIGVIFIVRILRHGSISNG